MIRRKTFLERATLEDEREALVRFLSERRPQGSPRNTVTVVFDGQEDVFGMPRGGDIAVVFSRGESADDVIKRMVEGSPDPRGVTLVTDDRDLAAFCRAQGAEVKGVAEFLGRVLRGSTRGSARSVRKEPSSKTISSVFAHRVNQELWGIWGSRDPRKKKT